MVYHVAADYRLWTREPQEMFRSNVDGTRNLLEAARRRRRGAGRLYQHGGLHRDAEGRSWETRQTPVGLEEMAGPYKRSKFLAEQVALEFAAEGFPVVIVNPTAPVGDHDFKPTPTGKIVVDFVRGRDAGVSRYRLERGGCAGCGRRASGWLANADGRENDIFWGRKI